MEFVAFHQFKETLFKCLKLYSYFIFISCNFNSINIHHPTIQQLLQKFYSLYGYDYWLISKYCIIKLGFHISYHISFGFDFFSLKQPKG